MMTGIEPIAIIGMSCRVPGAGDVAQFWRNLTEGVESVRFFTRAEQEAFGVPLSDLDDPAFVPAAPVLDEMDAFDAGLFGMSAREAAVADPQHRLFLELAHSALEDAGYDPARFDGDIAVYGGSGPDDYLWRHVARNRRVWETTGRRLAFVGNSPDYLATFVSYKLNLRGPSLSVHTACSTSLVALHLAAEALRSGETDLALAGGASIEIPHGHGYVYADGGTDSPDGHCRAFDERAAGTVWGSGGGVLVLKRLNDAIEDHDNVRAVILGNAINNDGSHKVAFSAPSQQGQAAVIAQALAVSGVQPRSIGFVEGHGTGTALGDPIEIAALISVYGGDRATTALGAVKSNIGHLSQGAGVAGVIKATLAMEHGLIPPTLHFERPSVDLGPFYVNAALSKWESSPRRSAVSSFGFGGTNAHVVLEQAPGSPRERPPRGAHLLQISARDQEALAVAQRRLATHLSDNASLDLADVAHTLRVGRSEHAHRLAVVATGIEDAVEALGAAKRQIRGEAGNTKVAMLFSGQGSQFAGMGRRLYATEPVYRGAVDECAGLLEGLNLLDLMESDELLRETRYTQPALFTVEYALAKLWESWGVAPAAMIGHSIGEYVAACLAGVFTLPDALRLVATRGRLMQSMPPGAMLAVRLDESAIAERLPACLSIATVNGPGTCVVGGPSAEVDEFAETLTAQGVGVTRLRTSHAFHSPMMEPILEEFTAAVAAAQPKGPTIPFLCNVTGDWITAEQATDPAYWGRQLRQPVRFGECVRTLLASGDWQLVEVGPGRQLAGLARMQTGREGRQPVPSLPGPADKLTDLEVMLAAAGRLWTIGVPVAIDAGPAWRVSLPTYPYQRQRHWVEPDPVTLTPEVSDTELPLREWFSVPTWRQAPPAPSEPIASCLLFGHPDLARLLNATEVIPGEGFEALGTGRYSVRPAERDDYVALFEATGVPARIVHAWALTPVADAWQAQEYGLFSVIALAQAIAMVAPEAVVQLDLVTTGAADPLGAELTRPENATLAGILRVLPFEQPGITVRLIDVDTAEGAVAELGRAPVERQVAVRGSRRWVPDFAATPLDSAPVTHLREGGTYLITGGLGGIGVTVALDIARRVRARLVLLARSALPPREEWDDHLLAHGSAGRLGRAISAIREMEAAGSEVIVYAADVTDAAQLSLMDERPDGIIHAAGLPGGGFIEVKDLDEARRVMAPKLAGTIALHRAFGDRDLDFVVLCSSVTGLAGGVGQVDYCAANAFLDAFARSGIWRSRVVSVNWGAWLEVGMAAETDPLRALPGRAVPAQEAVTALDHPLLTRRHEPADGSLPWCSGIVTPQRHWVLGEHRVAGLAVMPGFGHLEAVRAAANACLPRPSEAHVLELRDVGFTMPMTVADDSAAELQVRFSGSEFVVRSMTGGQIRVHARGSVGWVVPGPASTHDVEGLLSRCRGGIREVTEAELAQAGPLALGPHWRSLRRVHDGGEEELARLEAPPQVATELAEYPLHPALFDESTAFGMKGRKGRYLPFGFGRVLIRRPLTGKLWSHLRYREAGSGEIISTDLTMLDDNGNELVAVTEFMLRLTDAQAVTAAAAASGAIASPAIGIRPADGAAALHRLLSHDLGPQVVVAARPLPLVLAEVAAPPAAPSERPEMVAREGFVPPRNQTEQALAEIWAEILGVTGVGADDDFFDLGGNSLVAMQLIASIRSGLGVKLPMRVLFDAPTVSGMAKQVDELKASSEPVTSTIIPRLTRQAC